MASVPQKTLVWLYDVLKREYHDPNRTYSDIAQTLSRHQGFAPRTEVYTYENGTPALLLQLKGTIAVPFRGATYRFPVTLWIPHAYPHEPPLCYVMPTEEMLVRPGQHVSGDGRVYHHYLANWREAWERANVVDLLHILAEVFAKEPPVVARHQTPPSRPPPQAEVPPPLPPLPGREGSSMQSRPSPGHAPAPPPKQSVALPDATLSQPSRPGRYDAPPPLPPQPINAGPSTPGYQAYQPSGSMQGAQAFPPQQSGSNRVEIGRPVPSSQWYPQSVVDGHSTHHANAQPGRPVPLQQHAEVQNVGRPPSYGSSTGFDARVLPQQGPYQNVPQQLSQPHQPHPPQSPVQRQNRYPTQQYLGPAQIQSAQSLSTPRQAPRKPLEPSLLDSPFDISLPTSTSNANLPAPPIPRNPEKEAILSTLSSTLTQTLHQLLSQHSSSLNALSSQHSALVATHSHLQAELAQLHSIHQTISNNVAIMRSSLRDADKTIGSASARRAKGDIPPLDSSLLPPTVVGKQLYDTITDSKGVEAGIWALQEGFVRGRISAEVWSRRTRELAREGFRKKYMAKRIATGMGLDL